MNLSPQLLAKLACPLCRHALVERGQNLVCVSCNTQYRVENGIPILHKPAEYVSEVASLEYTDVPDGMPRKESSTFVRLMRPLLNTYLNFQKRLIPVTPLNPLYAIRKFSGTVQALPTPKTILDAGGGTSPYRQYLSSPQDEYIVMDVDVTAIQPDPARQAVVGDLHALPFCDGQFDLIIMSEVLEHLYDPATALANVSRALKPGGLLVLTTPQYWHVHGWPSDYFRYTNYGLRYLCERSGMTVEQFETKGGPFLLLYAVLKLNFMTFLGLPVIRLMLDVPLVMLFWGLDRLFFSKNLQRKNPDTAGWGLLARKTAEVTL